MTEKENRLQVIRDEMLDLLDNNEWRRYNIDTDVRYGCLAYGIEIK